MGSRVVVPHKCSSGKKTIVRFAPCELPTEDPGKPDLDMGFVLETPFLGGLYFCGIWRRYSDLSGISR
jgi:hypothetical protein